MLQIGQQILMRGSWVLCFVLFFSPSRSKTVGGSWAGDRPASADVMTGNTEPLTDVAPGWTALVTKWIPGPWPILLHIATTLLHKVDKFSV